MDGTNNGHIACKMKYNILQKKPTTRYTGYYITIIPVAHLHIKVCIDK